MGEFNAVEYKNQYNREHYARLSIQVRLEDRSAIDDHWKKKGFKSFNSYVIDLIRKDMYENSGNSTKVVNIDKNETININ